MLSVVMATYNGGRYLEQQLISIFNQTTIPKELIVSDDGSNDDTLDIIRRFSSHSEIDVIINRNSRPLGYAENFLIACELASQNYICFSDQDDVWLPRKLETMNKLIKTMPEISLFVHQGEVVDEELNPMGARHPVVHHSHIQQPLTGKLRARPPGFAMCFSRRLIAMHGWQNRPPDLEFPHTLTKHDTWITALANFHGGIYYSTDVLVNYRRHNNNSSYLHRGTHIHKLIRHAQDILHDPSHDRLTTLLEGYFGHASYFFKIANNENWSPSYRRKANALADQYFTGAKLINRRIDLYRGKRRDRAAIFLDNLRVGLYRQGSQLNRKMILQDAIAFLRSPNTLPVEAKGPPLGL